MKKFTIWFKNGDKYSFRCEDLVEDEEGLQWEIINPKGEAPIYLDASNVMMVTEEEEL